MCQKEPKKRKRKNLNKKPSATKKIAIFLADFIDEIKKRRLISILIILIGIILWIVTFYDGMARGLELLENTFSPSKNKTTAERLDSLERKQDTNAQMTAERLDNINKNLSNLRSDRRSGDSLKIIIILENEVIDDESRAALSSLLERSYIQALIDLEAGNAKDAEDALREIAEVEATFGDPIKAARAYRQLGAITLVNDTRRAVMDFREAVKYDPDNPKGWNLLGGLLADIGKLDEAKAAYQRVLDIGIAENDMVLQAGAIGNLGVIAYRHGDNDTAEDLFKQSLTIAEEYGFKDIEAVLLGNLGNIASDRHDWNKADSYQSRSIAIAEEHGFKDIEARGLGNIGSIFRIRTDYGDSNSSRTNQLMAQYFYQRSLTIAEEYGFKDIEAFLLRNLSIIAITYGNLEKAEEYCARSLAIAQKYGYKETIAEVFSDLGLIAITRSDLVAAKDFAMQSLAIAQEYGFKEIEAGELGKLGVIAANSKNFKLAEDYHMQSITIAQEHGFTGIEAGQLCNLADIYKDQGDMAKACSYWRRALDLFNKSDHPYMYVRVLGWLKEAGCDDQE